MSIRYITINEICTSKPHHLRRSEAMGGNGGQTNETSLIVFPIIIVDILFNFCHITKIPTQLKWIARRTFI